MRNRQNNNQNIPSTSKWEITQSVNFDEMISESNELDVLKSRSKGTEIFDKDTNFEKPNKYISLKSAF